MKNISFTNVGTLHLTIKDHSNKRFVRCQVDLGYLKVQTG